MLHWIEKTRTKPKPIRNQYAFLGAVGVTTVIALIWMLALPTHFSKFSNDDIEKKPESGGAFSRFFSEAKQNFASAIQATTGSDEEATSVEDATTTPDETIRVPQLEETTIEELNEKQENQTKPKPRTVLIGTTTKSQIATSTIE